MLSPLISIKRILQSLAKAEDQDHLVDLVVDFIKAELQVDVCSLYLMAEEELVLSATVGLDQSSVGKIRMPPGKGLVGTVAVSQHTLNLERGDLHPNYIYFTESGEESYKGFMGVPMIHLGKTLGVLVVQVRAPRRFTEEEEAFLITMGAHLAGSLSGLFKKATKVTSETSSVVRIQGLKGAPGISIAKALVVKNEIDVHEIPDTPAQEKTAEREILAQAIEAALEELEDGMSRLDDDAGETLTGVLEVYRLLLTSPEIRDGLAQGIDNGLSAASALKHTFLQQIEQFEQIEDAYLRARAEDLRILGTKVYRHMQSHQASHWQIDQPVVLMGQLVSVAHFARVPEGMLAGVVSAEGSAVSHTAVLANALGVPAVMGVPNEDLQAMDGDKVIIDGNRGLIVSNPPDTVVAEYEKLVRQEQALQTDLSYLKPLPAETLDGRRINLFTNTGLLADITPGLERGSEGVGLYRSEIPFMVHANFPTEEEQTRIYRKVLSAYSPKTVTMRTLDIGGDKALPYFPIHEDNPYLGWRGIRFTLDYTNILLDQIRAMLLASEGLNNLKLMIPMVSREDELDAFRRILDQAYQQLKEEGHVIKPPAIGIMVEVPAVVWMLNRIRDKVDFLCIGTNDLTQYLLAVDRNNSRVANLFDSLHPSVLGALKQIIVEANRLKIPVSVCGEMASDPEAALLLIAMGVRTLSMSAYKLPRIKSLIRHINVNDCMNWLAEVDQCADEKEIRAMIREHVTELGLGQLFD